MAIAALVVFFGFMLLCGLLRVYLQARRTGDPGDRRRAARGLPHQRWAEQLGSLGSLALGVAAPVAALVGLPPLYRLPALAWVGLALGVAGTLAAFGAQEAMGHQWRVGVDPAERTDLVTGGVFRVVRNPVMTATGVMLIGLFLMVPNVVAAVGLVTALAGLHILVHQVEEPALLAKHGEEYQRYAAKVGRFVPWLGRLR